jgi:hypothetical protein
VADIGPLIYQGAINASTNPDYPAAAKGDVYVISHAGKIGGASGAVVDANDKIHCKETTVAGDQATVGDKWGIIQGNLEYETDTGEIKMDGAVAVGVSGKVPRADHVHPSDTAKVDKVADHSLVHNDEIAKIHSQDTDTGTTSTTFQVDSGNAGPKLKNISGTMAARNAADNAYAPVKASAFDTGEQIDVINTEFTIWEIEDDNDVVVARCTVECSNITAGTQASVIHFYRMIAGTLTKVLTIDNTPS